MVPRTTVTSVLLITGTGRHGLASLTVPGAVCYPGGHAGRTPAGSVIMSDFFREVEEDIRRDRLERLARRYGPLVLSVVVAAVVAERRPKFRMCLKR